MASIILVRNANSPLGHLLHQDFFCGMALEGTKVRDVENPFELVRIVRSFDPCLACAVHLVTSKGRELGRFRVS